MLSSLEWLAIGHRSSKTVGSASAD